MISPELFALTLKELFLHYATLRGESSSNRIPLTPRAQKVWYGYLSKHLNDEQFERAIDQAILKCPFIPTPEQLVEMAGAGEKHQAFAMWQRIDDARKQFPTAPDSWREYNTLVEQMALDVVANKSLQTLGGLRALNGLSDRDLQFTRDKFLELYALFAAQRDELEQEEKRSVIQKLEGLAAQPALSPASEPLIDISEKLQEMKQKLATGFAMEPLVGIPAPGTAQEYAEIARAEVHRTRTIERQMQEGEGRLDSQDDAADF